MVVKVPAVITVDYEELEGSPTLSYDTTTGELVGERVLQCDWDDVFDLFAQLLGSVEGGDPTTGGGGVVYEPHRFPWNTSILARSAKISGFGTVEQDPALVQKGNKYAKGRIAVRYSGGAFGGPLEDPTEVEEKIEPTVRFITQGGRDLFWDDAGADPVDTNEELPGLMLRTFDYVARFPRMPIIRPELFSLIGACNQSQVLVPRLGYVFPAETLLYQLAGLDRVTTASGAGAFKAEVRLSYQPGGWNRFYRSSEIDGDGELQASPIYGAPTVNGQGQITSAGVVVNFYPPADFSPILDLLR